MNTKPFDPKTLADDLLEVRRIYAQFFATLDETGWDKPVKGGPKEWTLRETLAHLYALNGAGLESIQHALRREPYTFTGLETRYTFNDYNRKGIDTHQGIPMKALFAKLLAILDEAASIAQNLGPNEDDLRLQMSIYNRPLKIVEALSIIMIHMGVFHAAQVTEPVGQPPLWKQLSPEIRHRVVGRVANAFSLLYRQDIGGPLRKTLVFRVGGAGGGEWYVNLSPDDPTSGEGIAAHPDLVIHLREPAVLCLMTTSRLNLPLALLNGSLKLSGDLRLFLRMDTLFSVDARPPASGQLITRAKQWLYRGQRPNWIARQLNRMWANIAAKRSVFPGLVALEVTGRKSGRVVSFPLVMAIVNEQRYVVSMLGDNTQWVRNVRAAGGKAVLRNGNREEVQLEEMPVSQRAPILKAYLQAAPGARPHVPVDKDDPLAEFEKIAVDFPVFRLKADR